MPLVYIGEFSVLYLTERVVTTDYKIYVTEYHIHRTNWCINIFSYI